MTRIAGLTFAVLLVWCVPPADAACTGSGRSWTCSAGTTSSDIASTLNTASDGATLTFASGSYSWNSFVSFSNSKGATLICQTVGGCTVNVSGTVLGMNGNCAGTNTKSYRISGFTFTGGNSYVIWFNAYNTGGCTLSNLRIDHNSFRGQAAETTLLFFGDVDTVAYFYGLVDHNSVTNANSVALAQMIGGSSSNAPSGTRGTANNLYFEDNTITIATMTNAGLGCVDSWGGQSWVWRHNTTTNCLATSHGVTHAWGPVNVEVYGNHFVVNSGTDPEYQDCDRCFHHQGSGEFIVFDNVFTAVSGKSTSAIALTHYRSASPSDAGYPSTLGRCDGTSSNDGNRSGQYGYPCRRQPGRDPSGALQPMYIWNNRWSDTGGLITIDVENPWGAVNPSVADHIKPNRDYYSAVSASAQTSRTAPFTGSTGMGFGTLANRPTSCTTGLERGGGVGYFATDDGSQGTLYRCSAANTWTVQYAPYPYPHPLQSGAGADLTTPAAPSNVRIIQ